MKNILLVNGKKEFGHSKGDLNQYMNDIAEKQLNTLNYNLKVTVVDDGYDIEEEIAKWLWADVELYTKCQVGGWVLRGLSRNTSMKY